LVLAAFPLDDEPTANLFARITMSDAEASGGPFDLEGLRELIEMMESHGLTEVNLRRGEEYWRLKRGGAEPTYAAAAPPPMPAPAAPQPTASAVATPSAPAADSGVYVLCPTVGTFYAAPSPDDPPFVKIGDRVTPETVVCLVEAMKTFNQIPAEVSGTIAEILAKSGDAVDVNTKLFRVE
jgi:acetyl-CoA carboxylase biotin carboxyl carrier protein